MSAALLAVAQHVDSLASLGLVALTPMLIAGRSLGACASALLGAFVGTLFGCLVAAWIPSALRELGSSPWTAWSGLVVTAFWAKSAVYSCIALAVSATRQQGLPTRILGVAAVTVLGEWIVERSALGVPVALIGHSQIAVPGVAQIAAVGGVPAISGWLVACNVAIAHVITGDRRAVPGTAALVSAWLAAALFGVPIANGVRPTGTEAEEASFLVVQPDFTHSRRWVSDLQDDHLAEIRAFSARAAARHGEALDAVVWPENLLTERVDGQPELMSQLLGAASSLGIPIVTGSARTATGRNADHYRSSVLWIDPEQGLLAAIDKARAIPVLESGRPLPAMQTLERVFGSAAAWPKVEEIPVAGPLRGRFAVTPVLCYEVLFPAIVAARRPPESVAILNLVDDSWVEGDAATRLLAKIARFRAIEQRLTLIRVAHGGLSTVVDPFGAVVEELPTDSWASTVVRARAAPPPSLVERLSLAALPIASGLGVWWISQRLVRRIAGQEDPR